MSHRGGYHPVKLCAVCGHVRRAHSPYSGQCNSSSLTGVDNCTCSGYQWDKEVGR